VAQVAEHLGPYRGDPSELTERERMTRIESKHVEITRAPQDVYAFLQDMNNFQQLLPQDRISEWKSDGTSCSFKVSGAATIGIMLADGSTPENLKLKSSDKSPFPFTLDVHIAPSGDGTKAFQVFEADLNPFIKLMVENPLRNLFDHIADKMVAIHG
jgi:carbon monoxide dehydrogenase subunit G